MSFGADLKEIDHNRFTVALCTIAGTIGPGAMVLFLFQRPLFHSLDWYRFTVLAFCLPLPSLLMNTACALIFSLPKDGTGHFGDAMRGAYIGGAILTALTYFLFLFGAHVWEWRFKTFGSLIIATHIFCWVLSILVATAGRAQTNQVSNRP
jgi:cobalamin synthase